MNNKILNKLQNGAIISSFYNSQWGKYKTVIHYNTLTGMFICKEYLKDLQNKYIFIESRSENIDEVIDILENSDKYLIKYNKEV